MTDHASLLDQALALGDKEMQLLAAGQYDEVGRVAEERSRLVVEAIEGANPLDLNMFREKLLQLSALQGRLTEQAKHLHETVRLELLRVKKESERIDGYARGRKLKASAKAPSRNKG